MGEAALCLVLADKATRMTGEAVLAPGGNGRVDDHPVRRMWRDARLDEIGAGTGPIRRMLIGCERSAKPSGKTCLLADGTAMTVTLRVLNANDTEALGHVRQFFRSYAGWLGVDLSFQKFDEEMASLPGAYAPPDGRPFYAENNGWPAGCVGVRPLSEGVCEMKRLYVVEPEQRGFGIGRDLALAAIKAAKQLGYRKIEPPRDSRSSNRVLTERPIAHRAKASQLSVPETTSRSG